MNLKQSIDCHQENIPHFLAPPPLPFFSSSSYPSPTSVSFSSFLFSSSPFFSSSSYPSLPPFLFSFSPILPSYLLLILLLLLIHHFPSPFLLSFPPLPLFTYSPSPLLLISTSPILFSSYRVSSRLISSPFLPSSSYPFPLLLPLILLLSFPSSPLLFTFLSFSFFSFYSSLLSSIIFLL